LPTYLPPITPPPSARYPLDSDLIEMSTPSMINVSREQPADLNKVKQ